MRLLKAQKITRSADYQQLFTKGKSIHCGGFIFRVGQIQPLNKQARARIGIIASRKVGKAHKRNYAKRIFREIFRKYQEKVPSGSDIVIIVRSNFDQYSYDQIEGKFLKIITNPHTFQSIPCVANEFKKGESSS